MLAAAVVEDLDAARAGVAHQFPVLEVVGGQVARGFVVAGVVGQDLVAEVEAQHAGQRPAVGRADRQHAAVVAEGLAQRLEVAPAAAPACRGGARCRHTARRSGRRRRRSSLLRPFLMPLRTIARCLRGMASMLASSSGRIGLAEGDVQILPRPVGVARAAAGAARGGRRRVAAPCAAASASSAARGLVVAGGHAAIDGKRQADQRMAEQQALDLRQRQHADDLRRRARRTGSGCRGGRPRAITRCQAARWKKVACGQAEHERVPARRGGGVARARRWIVARRAPSGAGRRRAGRCGPCGPSGSPAAGAAGAASVRSMFT